MKAASAEELAGIPGIGKKRALQIVEAFQDL